MTASVNTPSLCELLGCHLILREARPTASLSWALVHRYDSASARCQRRRCGVAAVAAECSASLPTLGWPNKRPGMLHDDRSSKGSLRAGPSGGVLKT